MTRYTCVCMYCGYSWSQFFYNKSEMEAAKCGMCGDTSLKIGPVVSSNVFGYEEE